MQNDRKQLEPLWRPLDADPTQADPVEPQTHPISADYTRRQPDVLHRPPAAALSPQGFPDSRRTATEWHRGLDPTVGRPDLRA